MENDVILRAVDHTLLNPAADFNGIKRLCGEAIKYKTASVCIPPSYVKRVFDTYGDALNICTVIGFPNGYHATEAKLFETELALKDGALEIDMVINLGDVKNGCIKLVEGEIRAVKAEVGGRILKVIIETCYLNEEEKIALCEAVTNAGADFIKTSTGFGTKGAVMEDVLLFKRHIGEGVKIKAAGGIRTRDDMVAFIEAGCARLGTSSAIKILEGFETEGY